MTLEELEHHEQVVLTAMLGWMARLDGHASIDEVELLQRIAGELGEGFERVAAEASKLDAESIRNRAITVTRGDAREVIYELLHDMAVRDSIVEAEGALLDWLADLWELPKRGVEEPE